MLLVTCKWCYCCRCWALHGASGVPIAALLFVSATVAFGLICMSNVPGWLTSVEVFAAVPIGVSCILSCWVGGYFVARWNDGALAGFFLSLHSATGGRRAMRARLVFWMSGASGMGAHAVDKKSTFLMFFQNKGALLLAAVKGLNTSESRCLFERLAHKQISLTQNPSRTRGVLHRRLPLRWCPHLPRRVWTSSPEMAQATVVTLGDALPRRRLSQPTTTNAMRHFSTVPK